MASLHCTLVALLLFSVYSVSSQISTINPDECDFMDNCSGKGECAIDDEGDWYCDCNKGYATYPEPDDDEADEDKEYCNYEQKSQLTAFLLAWFLGAWGGGQWYLGLTGIAAGKLCMTLAVCYCIPCLACVLGDRSQFREQNASKL